MTAGVDYVVRFLKFLPVMVMPKTGPKSKPHCPIDFHFRPSEKEREFLDSLGPSGVQEKLSRMLEKEMKKQCPDTVGDLQSKIIETEREIKRLNEIKIECDRKLACLNIPPNELELIYTNIHKSVFPEKYHD
jgi:hypothetical protein